MFLASEDFWHPTSVNPLQMNVVPGTELAGSIQRENNHVVGMFRGSLGFSLHCAFMELCVCVTGLCTGWVRA